MGFGTLPEPTVAFRATAAGERDSAVGVEQFAEKRSELLGFLSGEFSHEFISHNDVILEDFVRHLLAAISEVQRQSTAIARISRTSHESCLFQAIEAAGHCGFRHTQRAADGRHVRWTSWIATTEVRQHLVVEQCRKPVLTDHAMHRLFDQSPCANRPGDRAGERDIDIGIHRFPVLES